MSRTEQDFLNEFLCEENQHELVAMARALCPFTEACPDDVVLVCVAVVEAAGKLDMVAEALGFSRWQVRSRVQSRVSQQIIKKLTKEKLSGEGYLKAVAALIEVAGSTAYPGAARNNASKTLIELAEKDDTDKGAKGDGGLDLNVMTLAQLEAFCNSIKQDIMRLPSPIALQGVDKQGG